MTMEMSMSLARHYKNYLKIMSSHGKSGIPQYQDATIYNYIDISKPFAYSTNNLYFVEKTYSFRQSFGIRIIAPNMFD